MYLKKYENKLLWVIYVNSVINRNNFKKCGILDIC